MSKRGRLEIIEDVIRSIGFGGTYQGLRSMVYAVDLAYHDPDMLNAVTKELYPAVAKRCHNKSKNVERNLRTAVSVCWDRGDRELLSKMAGFTLREKPSTGEVIDYIVHYIMREGILDEFEEEA